MKALQHINLLGVLALAVLCAAQWQRDRQLNLHVNRLEKVRFDQASRLAQQEETVRGLGADLAHFKARFTKSERELNDALQKTITAEREVRHLTVERDELKSRIGDWATAVATRDERLQQANGHVAQLSDELNAFIRRFNELATNHNQVVKELNELRARAIRPGAQ
jgi:chromosome segregation ATPase